MITYRQSVFQLIPIIPQDNLFCMGAWVYVIIIAKQPDLCGVPELSVFTPKTK